MLRFSGAYVSVLSYLNYNMEKYKTTSHAKHLLQYHIIFVCKYRCDMLENDKIDTLVKQILTDTAKKDRCTIHFIESDKNHIHLMIETVPNINLSQLVNKLKSRTAYHLWRELPQEMHKYYWSNKWCWTRGYFISTIGNVSGEILREYILNQGKEK